jgi:hypothetical protein
MKYKAQTYSIAATTLFMFEKTIQIQLFDVF